MKRRTFIKLLSGLPLIGTLPVLAKTNEVNLDDYEIITKMADTSKSTLTMWGTPVKDGSGSVSWVDISGNGNHLIQSNSLFSPSNITKFRNFDVPHNEKERNEIAEAMLRGEPDSYFKRFRGYRANE